MKSLRIYAKNKEDLKNWYVSMIEEIIKPIYKKGSDE